MPHQSNNLDKSTGKPTRREGTLRHACGDCRRLKKRCSGDVPCSNCVKRGCEATCPEGVTRVGNEKRFTQAKLKAVRDRNRHLATQINILRNALSNNRGDEEEQETASILHHSPEMDHERNERQSDSKEGSDTDDMIDAFGSFSVSERGRTVFFGQTANSWFLLQNEDGFREDGEVTHTGIPQLPSIFPLWNHGLPYTQTVNERIKSIRDLLPSSSVARKMADLYFANAGWMHAPVLEDEFYKTVLSRAYDPGPLPTRDFIESQNLAIVYLVLALGTLLDTDKPPRSPEAHSYYELACAALSIDSPLEQPSIPAIQALILLCFYQLLAQIEGPRWMLAGLAVRLCLSIGLHRDSAKFKLSPEATKRRRSLMWTVFNYEMRAGLHYGRPVSVSPHYIDTKIAHGTTTDEAGVLEMSYTAWQHRFSSQCYSVVHEYVLSGGKQSYKTILELDRKVREFYVPPSLRIPGFEKTPVPANQEPASYRVCAERYDVYSTKLFTILYMHRGFFAKAMEDNPDDPLASKYSPSVLAVYNAACAYIGVSESFHSRYPAIVDRMWFIYGHVFSCAVVLGSIACKIHMPLAPSAFASLETACRLFERLSGNPRSAKVLSVLQRLKNQAFSTMHPNVTAAAPSVVDILKGGLTNLQHFDEPSVPPTDHLWPHSTFSEFNGADYQSSEPMSDSVATTPESLMCSWPSLLDIHYRELDDVPSYPDPESLDTIETMETHVSWQRFMEQFSFDKS